MNEKPSIENVIPSANAANASQSIKKKIMNLNDIKKQTMSESGKSKVKRIFQKIDFKTLQESGFDRQIAKVIYQKNNESKVLTTSSSLSSKPTEFTILDKNDQSTCNASEILSPLERSSGKRNISCRDLHEAQSQMKSQNIHEETKNIIPVGEHSAEVKDDLMKMKLLAKNASTPKLCIYVNPPANECPTRSTNCEKSNSTQKSSDMYNKTAVKKGKFEAAKLTKNQIDIPKASIKASKSRVVSEAILQKKISRRKSTTNTIQNSNTKHIIVLENNIPSESEMMDLASIKPIKTPSHPLGEATSKKVSRRRSSINPIRKSITKSLIVLENKVLSENEMIDLTSLRLPDTNTVSCSLPLTKPLEEILKKKTAEIENVTKTNAGMDSNHGENSDIKTNTKNECNENVIGMFKESHITEAIKGGEIFNELAQLTLDFQDTENKSSKSPVKSMSCFPPTNISTSETAINSLQQSFNENIQNSEFIAAVPTSTGFEHSKSAVQIINEPKVSDTFSAVDFLASLDTTGDVNQISSVAVSLEELNLSASFGRSFSATEIGKFNYSKANDVTQTNINIKTLKNINEIVTIEQQNNHNNNDKVDHNIIILDDNVSDTVNILENVKNCCALPPSTSSAPPPSALPLFLDNLQELSISPINCTSGICEKQIDSSSVTPKQNVLADPTNNEHIAELKVNDKKKSVEHKQSMEEVTNNSPLNSSKVEIFDEDYFASLHNIVGDQKSESVDNLDGSKISSNINVCASFMEKPLEIIDIKKSLIDSPTKPHMNEIPNGVKTEFKNFTNKINNDEVKESSEQSIKMKLNEVRLQSLTNNDGKTQSFVDNKSFKMDDHSIQNDNHKRPIENVDIGRCLKRIKLKDNDKISKRSRKGNKKGTIKEITVSNIDYKSCKESIPIIYDKQHKLHVEKVTREDGASAIISTVIPNKLVIDPTNNKVQQNVKHSKEEKECGKHLQSSNSESNKKLISRKKIEEKRIAKNLIQVLDTDCTSHKESSGTVKHKQPIEKLEKKVHTYNKTKKKKCDSEDDNKTDNPVQDPVPDASFEESNKNQKVNLIKKIGTPKTVKPLKATFKKKDNSNDSVVKCANLNDTSIVHELTEIKSETSYNNDDLEFLSINSETESPSKFLPNINSTSVSTDIEFGSIHNPSQRYKSVETGNQLRLHFENSTNADYVDDDDDSMEFLGFEDNDQVISEKPEVITHIPDNARDNNENKDGTLKSWFINIEPNQDNCKHEQSVYNNLNIPLKKRRDLSSTIKPTNKSTFEILNCDTSAEQSRNRKKRRKKSESLIEQTEKVQETLSENVHKIGAPLIGQNDITSSLKKKGRIRKEEINFNPRLLLITKREQLDTDVKLTDDFDTTANNGSDSNKKAKIQCGLCLKYINSSNLWISHLSEHYGIGWKVGEPALNLTCRSSVLNHMIAYYKETQIKGLSCRICQKIYRSALGLLMHIEICGLPPEKVECEFCKRLYTKISLANHKRICSAATRLNIDGDGSGDGNGDGGGDGSVGGSGDGGDGDDIRAGEQQCQTVEQSNKVIGNTGRVKRISTIKAETKLKKINAQLTKVDVEEDIKSLINYVACNMKSHMAKWQKDLSVFGKAFCPQKTCKYHSAKQLELEGHVKSCKYIQQPGYYCKLCKTLCFDSVDLVTQHIQEKHKDKSKSPSDNSDCDVNTDEEDSSTDDSDLNHDNDDIENDDNDDAVSYGGKTNLKSCQSKKRKKLNTTICTTNNDSAPLKGKKGFCIRYSITEKTLLHKWLNFLNFNYSDVPLYTKCLVEYVMKQSNDLSKCLPKQLHSMKFVISENLNFSNDTDKGKSAKSPKLKWLQLKRFETLQNNNDENFLFCGAPVKALYWVPLPNNINEQYLVVICRKDLYHYARLSEPKQLKSTLLIFKVKESIGGTIKYPQIQLHYGVYIEHGPIHDVSFLPSGGYDESNNRLALMAVANITDIINVYALPINFNITKGSSYNANDNDLTLLDLKPAFQLQLNTHNMKDNTNEEHHSCKVQCLKICWSEAIGHKHIFGGFSNGFLSIWDITDNQEDNLNRFVLDNTIIFVPINYWYVGENCIKHIHIHYDTNGPRWLAVVGKYRRYIIYDIRDFMQPIIIKCEGQSSIICTMDWPLMFETFLLGVCDCIAYNGRCLFAVNPIGANFSHNKLDNMLSGVVIVHYTPLLNLYVCGMANGDIVLLQSKKLPMEWPERKNLTLQRVFCTMDVKPLLDGEINYNNNNNNDDDDDVTMTFISSLTDDFQMFDPLYKEKYGLVFGGKLFKISVSQHQSYMNEKRRPPHGILPYKRLSSVRCNLNIQGKQLIAFGYDNGFVRVIDFNEKHYFE